MGSSRILPELACRSATSRLKMLYNGGLIAVCNQSLPRYAGQEHIVKPQKTPSVPFSAVPLVLGLLLASAGISLAQDATPAAAAHPAHIHAGTCDELGDVTFPLSDVVTTTDDSTPSPALTGTPGVRAEGTPASGGEVTVAGSTSQVDATLDDLLAADHAINLHESADNIQNYIACGDLAGTASDGELRVELQELNGSGYTGEVHLVDNGDGTTTVTVRLMRSSANGAGTPVAQHDQGTAASIEVSISNFAYNPDPVTIKVGQSVTWTNEDSTPHTATAKDRDVLQSGTLNQGESFTQTFNTPGTYEYFCEFHEDMNGVIVVE